VVDKLFQVKRVLDNKAEIFYHSKVIAVDQKPLDIGSDNAYPCYNEEHGICIEHKAAIDAWYRDYWQGLWANSSWPETEDMKDFKQWLKFGMAPRLSRIEQ